MPNSISEASTDTMEAVKQRETRLVKAAPVDESKLGRDF